FDCSSLSAATPCQYASLNGYNGKGLTANTDSNDVAVSFPSSLPGLPVCAGAVVVSCAPPPGVWPYPFLQVSLTDRFKLTFSSLISGQKTMDVKAKASCGLIV